MRKSLALLSCFACCLLSGQLSAQHYRTTLGLRLANGSYNRSLGISLEQKILPRVTLEALAQTDFLRNTSFHLMGKRHHSLLTKRLNLYWGGGMSVGWEQHQVPTEDGKVLLSSQAGIGVDMLLGLELTLAKMNISLDYKPNISLSQRQPWLSSQIGVAFRPVLVTERQAKKKQREKARRKRKKEKELRKEEQPGLDLWPFN